MKVDLKIPDTLGEITLKDYQKYMKIVEDNEDADEFLNLKAVEIFCHIKIKKINDIKRKDFTDIIEILNKTFNEEPEHKLTFFLNEIEYGFIPCLDDMSIGEFIDLSKYIAEIENLHRAMAVMYRPITFSKGKGRNRMYLIEKYKGSKQLSCLCEREKYRWYESLFNRCFKCRKKMKSAMLCDIMKSAPVNVVLGSQVFFWNLSNELLRFTMGFLQEKGQTNSHAKRILEENTDGIRAFTQSLEEICYSLRISLN